jgi:hypothetical protein
MHTAVLPPNGLVRRESDVSDLFVIPLFLHRCEYWTSVQMSKIEYLVVVYDNALDLAPTIA